MQIKDQENVSGGEENGFRLLKNPLPSPPKRSHIRMEFDLTDSDEDDFDLEIATGMILISDRGGYRICDGGQRQQTRKVYKSVWLHPKRRRVQTAGKGRMVPAGKQEAERRRE